MLIKNLKEIYQGYVWHNWINDFIAHFVAIGKCYIQGYIRLFKIQHQHMDGNYSDNQNAIEFVGNPNFIKKDKNVISSKNGTKLLDTYNKWGPNY